MKTRNRTTIRPDQTDMSELPKRQTTIYLDQLLRERLFVFILRKHDGLMHKRNEVISRAIDVYLTAQGF